MCKHMLTINIKEYGLKYNDLQKFKTRYDFLNKFDITASDFFGLHTKLYKFISPKA